MTSRPNRRFLGIGELGRRLVAAFVAVAIAAVLAEVIVGAFTFDADVNRVVSDQMSFVVTGAARASRSAYDNHGWHPAALTPVIEMVGASGAAVQVDDRNGAPVRSSPGYASFPDRHEVRAPVVVGGTTVGSVRVRFGQRGIGGEVAQFESARWRVRLVAFGIAVVIALAVSTLIARQITAPLERMLTAMRRRAAGDRGARVADVKAVGVLREILEGYNSSTDALDQRDRAQRNLVADVAHQLRTPVAVLQAGHEALLDGITEPTQASLGSLRDEVLRLGRVLEDLQALAAAEAAALQLSPAQLNLAAISRDVADNLGEAFDLAGVTLTTELRDVDALCDDKAVREILANLLTNAMKYTPAGGRVVVSTGLVNAHKAGVAVRDTGLGIPPDELPHVTERFFRGRNASQLAGGSGFGLTIVTELVSAQRGNLGIVSEPGIGTTVTVTLPRVSVRRLTWATRRAGPPRPEAFSLP
jgi:two-component system, OmpR family, sensor histidine kinase BaeS